ncbi:MAG: hypothetical protein RL367_728 [Pseudomonadota bacterium]
MISRVILVATLLLGAVGALAGGPFNDQPASLQSLPGDRLPPFGMLGPDGELKPLPPLPPGGIHRGPGSPPESTAAGPSLVQATRAAQAAVAACAKQGYRVGVAVIDSGGDARAMLTADGSDGSHVFVAMRKAEAALAFAMPSSAARDRIARDPAQIRRVTPAMFVEGGAVPIRRGNKIIGALGVSGAGGAVIGRQDELCASDAMHDFGK